MTDHSTDHWHGRHYDADHIKGPVSFLNPTTRVLPVLHQAKHPGGTGETQQQTLPGNSPDPRTTGREGDTQAHTNNATSAYTVWRSRDNRKGRHALHLTPSSAPAAAVKPTTTASALWSGIARMLLRYPIYDISYDVATIFTLGSVVWVINGFFVLLPLTNPSSTFPSESAWGGGVSAVVGATIFEVGSIFLMIEAVNENRVECFGWALERALSVEEPGLLRREEGGCRHHHVEKRALVTSNGKGVAEGEGSDDEKMGPVARKGRTWTWWPSWYEMRTHYLRDIGFLACLAQWIGATVFWISGFTGLPQILDVLTVPATNGIYWLPQVVGGSGFIISSFLFMLETQPKWYIPALNVLGWHIGFWNLIGALGFTLCGALGFASDNAACETALTWATFIGSWAFLIGSVIQWYESLDKYPVIVDKNLSRLRTTENLGEKGEGQV
ncbi:unnamed protein product [Discula destructiva]